MDWAAASGGDEVSAVWLVLKHARWGELQCHG